MEQTGYVTEINNGILKVRVDRESACGGHCVSCKGCPSSAVIVECDASPDISVGDTVLLSVPTSRFFKNAFWGYGFITLLILVGAILGYKIGTSDNASVLGAFAGLFIGLVTVKLIFRKKTVKLTAKKITKE